MAINIKFDTAGNPEPPTIILANRNGNKLGQLDVDVNNIELIDKFNDVSEFSFTLNKYVDGKLTYLWDKVVNFKLVYCKEWDMWFEINVELDEATETVKTVFCTQLGQAELSQIMLYDIEINTERDIERDDYKITILYDPEDSGASLLGRLLEKAPHYSVRHIDSTIANIQRSFSFDDTSIYDAFQEIAEEIGCLFVFESNSDDNGYPYRRISVYDLQQTCNDCGHRGEFTEVCPKCNSTNIKMGYGKDTLIFVTSDELASNGIQLTTDTDSVKNCFKLEAGDDLMTATVRNRNPNGTDYIWYFSDDMKEDMPEDLVYRIEGYDDIYNYYKNNCVIRIDEELKPLSQNESKTFSLGIDYKVGDVLKFTCPFSNAGKAEVIYGIGGSVGELYLFATNNDDYATAELEITSSISFVKVNEYVNVYSIEGRGLLFRYNELVEKYKIYNEDLETINNSIIGYSSLMNAYYNTIDLGWYLKSGLMPNVEMSDTDAETEANRLSTYLPVLIGVNNMDVVSLATANSAVLALAKTVVRSDYRVQIDSSQLNDEKTQWTGKFTITNYSDDEDTYTSTIPITRGLTDEDETLIRQKLEKELNKENTDDLSITGLFAKELEGDDGFKAELKKYALKPLTSFHDACQACIDILIEQGVGKTTSDLYKSLYSPYYNKLLAIESEMKVREEEINIVLGVYDLNGDLISDGLQTKIEKCKNDIQDILNFQNYLGEDLWLEFCAYRREDKYSNDNYISDGLNNAELFERALEFYEAAENEIYKSSELQHSISTTLNNLLAIPKFGKLVESFEVGNWIRVRIDEQIYKLRLLEYRINYGDFNNIPVEFSDVFKIKNGITDVQDILSQASSMASSYDSVQKQATQGNEAQNRIRQWLSEGLDASLVQIQNNTNEDIVIDNNGLLGRSYSDIMGGYSNEQIRLTHNIIAYTDDNWKTVKQAIGKHGYKYYDGGKLVDGIGYGMSAEFVTAGYISGSQIIGGDIYSDNYKQVVDAQGKVTKTEGSYINLRDGTFSFGGGKITFNDNTLTINPDNKLGLTESEVTTITENCISTTDVIAENLYIRAANIKDKLTVDQIEAFEINAEDIFGDTIEGMNLIGGSLLIGDKDTTTYAEIASGGTLNCAGANISGVINATSGSFTGTINATTGNFSDSVTIGGTAITAGYLRDLYNYAVNGSTNGTSIIQIDANTGSVGGFDITGSSLYTNNHSSIGDTSYSGVYVGTDGLSIYGKGGASYLIADLNNNTFKFSGDIYANGGYFSGELRAPTGAIGDWTIGKTNSGVSYLGTFGSVINTFFLSHTGVTANISEKYGDKSCMIYACGKFAVTKDGELYAEDAYITGDITATSGTFTGTVYASDGTFTGTVTAKSGYIGTSTDGFTINNSSFYKGRSSFEGVGKGVHITANAIDSTSYGGISFGSNSYQQYIWAGRHVIIGGSGSSYAKIALKYNGISFNYSNSSNNLDLSLDTGGQIGSITTNNDRVVLAGTWYGTSGSTIASDENKKNTISPIDEKYEPFFDKLVGCTYKYNDGTSDRLHTGFIAQRVKEALDESNINTSEFAGLVIHNNDDGSQDWALRYSEFVALNTWQIQKLKARVAELESKIELLTNN